MALNPAPIQHPIDGRSVVSRVWAEWLQTLWREKDTVATVTVATLPTNSLAGRMVFVSDASGGSVIAFYDGTNWRRVTDRAIVT